MNKLMLLAVLALSFAAHAQEAVVIVPTVTAGYHDAEVRDAVRNLESEAYVDSHYASALYGEVKDCEPDAVCNAADKEMDESYREAKLSICDHELFKRKCYETMEASFAEEDAAKERIRKSLGR